jgi:TPR repeat protein
MKLMKRIKQVLPRLVCASLLVNLAVAAPLMNAVSAGEAKPGVTQSDVDALLSKGDKIFKAGNYVEALIVFQEAQEKAPSDLRVLNRVFYAAKEAKEPKAGLTAAGTMLKLKPDLKDDAEFAALRAGLEALGGAGAPGEQCGMELSAAEQRKYDALVIMVDEAQQANGPAEQRRLLYDLLEKSSELLHLRKDLLNVWAMRADAAAELGESLLAREAGQTLLHLGAENSKDSQIQRVLARLERKNLLGREFLFAYPATLHDLLKNAQEDDMEAEEILGEKLDTTNPEHAGYWFRKAAEHGLSIAQFNLGIYYDTGKGPQRHLSEAVRWYRKAAEQNYARAQLNLGFCYLRGEGVSKDLVEAVKWYRKAADQGQAKAQFTLGTCYDEGVGTQKDLAEAVRWYRKAAEQNHAKAQLNLGICYLTGEGVSKDLVEAVKWYRKAADQGDPKAQCYLGVCYDYGRGVSINRSEALRWYRKAAEQGNAQAQCNLGSAYYNGTGVKRDLAEAQRLLRQAADQGDDTAAENLRKLNF